MQLKIIRDNFNGNHYQIKYLETRPGYPKYWFDFGSPFTSRRKAKILISQYNEKHRNDPPLRTPER